jgi:beta-glucosidase/6-phospho-beta-glucosidase/beta-galactosidase
LRSLFKSFLQAGFECSTHKLVTGKRLDLVSATAHDRFVKQDYRRLAEFGIQTVREGLRWPEIEKEAGRLDFSAVLPVLCAAKEDNIEVLWDLLHFGWPDHLSVFTTGWVDAFAELAHGFAVLLRDSGAQNPFIAAVNETSFVAWAGGDVAYLNPFERNRGGELKRQLVRGAIAATEAVRSIIPGALMVAPDPVIHIVGNPGIPGDVEQAEACRQSMFEAWDMLTGRVHRDLGGKEAYIDVIGINYYDRNQRWNFGQTLRRGDAEYRPFHLILKEVYDRYRRPIFIAETGTEGEGRPEWFTYIAKEVGLAMNSGVRVEGICLYPILNHPGWDDDRHCHNGLWDYADETGEREIYHPLAEEIHRFQHYIKGEHK